jgi:hypothetical protein
MLSARQSENRLQRLHEISKEAEALAEHSESASYQAFARLLAKAEGVGATIARETIIAVGSAFISRQYVWPKLPASSSGTN